MPISHVIKKTNKMLAIFERKILTIYPQKKRTNKYECRLNKKFK